MMAAINVCRICLSNSETLNILETNENIDRILTKHRLNFEKLKYNADQITTNDIIEHICTQCWQKIDEFDKFYDEAEKIHLSYVSNYVKKNEEYSETIYSVSIPVNVVCKTDAEDEIDNDCLYQPEEVFGVDTNTNNSMEDDEDGPDEDDDGEDEDGENDDEEEYEDSSSEWSDEDEAKLSRNRRTTTATKPKIKTRKPSSKSKKSTKAECAIWDRGSSENAKRIKTYFTMNCDICANNLVFRNFLEVQHHFRDEHNMKGYVMCCNQRFRRLGRILQHCTWHENPETFKCDICNRCFQDNDRLTKHNVSKHIPNDEKVHKCDICGQQFAKKHLLNTHIKYRHTEKEDRPFACTVEGCDSRFVLAALLRFHVKKVHEQAHSRVCDICAKYFKCPESYERHYELEHSNIDQRVQCEICHHWFKHAYTLAGHMRRHKATQEICKYCGRVSKNKMTLRTHIRNMHSDVDTTFKPKNEFPCTICGKVFAKRQTLKEHLSLHTGEAHLYACSFCPRTFRSSANMYAHRKKVHPREYEEKCANKTDAT